MSQETYNWLNTMTLIGFTEKRGKAWHYRASDQGAEPNHYAGAIPPEDVLRRLFDWEAERVPMQATVQRMVSAEIDGETVEALAPVLLTSEDRIIIVHPQTNAFLGTFKSGFQIHPYPEWLMVQAEAILDAQLGIASAGLLKGGAVAWVTAEMPETISTPQGVDFRPFFTSAGSLDGSLSSTYATGSQLPVCDNTLSAALGAAADKIKIKHSRLSLGKLSTVREQLNLIYVAADDFQERLELLCSIPVTDLQWAKFLDAHVGEIPAEKGRTRTIREGHRDELSNLWNNDMRVAPWSGTAFGVLQAVNTNEHHIKTVRGASRPERNMERMVAGKVDALDNATLTELEKILELELV